MADPNDPVIQTCSACGTLIDVTDEEPFALMHCPTCGAAQRVRRNFDHFELQEVLGAGGMGAVYRALDTNLNRPVALKLLRKEYSTDQEFVAQFEKEASITASINHPNVVKVYTAGQDHGLVYIAMELVDKGSLDDLMELQGRVAEAQVLEVGIQIAQGLHAAYQRGLIHRDVKPGNILFADAHTAKIVDFGLAVLQEHASTVAGDVWGTPYYVAPEKLDNQPEDMRSDLYSLGATLFHALAGRPPFEAETASMVALKHLKSQAVSLQAFAPDVSGATAYVINKTLEKEPGDRYQTYPELIQHLEYARGQLLANTAKGPPVKARVVIEDSGTAKAMGWITFGMIAVVVLGGVVFWTQRGRFKPSEPTVDPRIEEIRKANASFEPRFKAARGLLVAGKFAEAAAACEELAAQPGVPQPLLNWITLHQGLALLLAGKDADARPIFATIVERGTYSTDPADEEIVKFFVESARKLAGTEVIPDTVSTNYLGVNYKPLALFLFALKDWQLTKFDEAARLFRQYKNARPAPPHEWIADYQDLATQFIDAYSAYKSATDGLLKATAPDETRAAIDAARAAHGRIAVPGKLAEILAATIEGAEKKLLADAEENMKKAAAQQEADAKATQDMRTKVGALLPQFKFAEAHIAAKALTPASEKLRNDAAQLVKKTEWLAQFKSTLIADINAASSPQPIVRRNGLTIPGSATRANENGIEVRTQFGGTGALWTDLAVDTVLNMARTYIRPNLPPDAVADRQWLCGSFAMIFGKPKEGRELLNLAAQGKPSYKDELSAFPETPATP